MTGEGKPGAVFDCNVYFQATRNPKGPAAELLRLLEADRFALFLTSEIWEEVRATFTDQKVRAKNRGLTDGRIDALFQLVSQHAALRDHVPERFACERDPDDAKYVNLALAAGAGYLVTRDKDLLDLMSEAPSEGASFSQQFPGLTLLDPVAFLAVLRAKEKAEDAEQG